MENEGTKLRPRTLPSPLVSFPAPFQDCAAALALTHSGHPGYSDSNLISISVKSTCKSKRNGNICPQKGSEINVHSKVKAALWMWVTVFHEVHVITLVQSLAPWEGDRTFRYGAS